MDVPDALEAELDDESVAARVPLKGEDALFVTPTRTLVYRADGLLSDESVAAYPHDAERVEVSEGRRKATVRLDYGLDGVEEFSVPVGDLDEALHPVLAGVLNASAVTDPGETVKRTYRFSEFTLVVTSARLVKHVGAAVWDEEYEEIPFESVTDVAAEEGNVASQLVLETGDRTQRLKVPNERFRDVRETVEDALFASYDAQSYEEFRDAAAVDEDAPEETADPVDFQNSGLDPIETSVGEEDDAADDVASEGERGTHQERERERERAQDRGGSTEAVDEPDTAGNASATSQGEVGETPAPSAAGEAADSRPDPESGPTSEPEASEANAVAGDPGGEPPLDREVVRAELEDLRETVERQQALLEDQRERIEDLLDATRDR